MSTPNPFRGNPSDPASAGYTLVVDISGPSSPAPTRQTMAVIQSIPAEIPGPPVRSTPI